MDLENLSKADLREILRTSRGFPAQQLTSKRKPGSHPPMAHATSAHLHGTKPEPYKKDQTVDEVIDEVKYKSKFYMLEDMASALWHLLQTAQGKSALRSLAPGARKRVDAEIRTLFDVEVYVEGRGRIKFTKGDQSKAGRSFTRCKAILDGRDRNGTLHLHVQTFYPILDDGLINEMLDNKDAG